MNSKALNLEPFRLDIDELISEFAEGNMTTLDDMTKIWLAKRFTCIFEAKPNSKLGFFMQSLYAHCLGYMTSTASLSHRLGGLYTLYCLHETQPFKPPFRIYICKREIRRLKELVIDAKKEKLGVVPYLVKSMLDRNLFLFGATDLKEGSVEERVNEITSLQNSRIQHANKKLFEDTQVESYIHMDMGKEFEVDSLKKMLSDYAMAKKLAMKGAEKVIDTTNIKHIAENQILLGDVVENTSEDWNAQKEKFYQKTGYKQQKGKGKLDAVVFDENSGEDVACAENDDSFGDELEQELLSLTEF